MADREAVLPACVVLSPEVPFPMAGGGALRSASLLHYLAGRYEVDLIVFRQPHAADPRLAIPPGLVRSCTVIDLPANRRSLPARVLRNTGRFVRRVPPLVDRFAGFGEAVTAAIRGRRYELGIVEHSWAAPYAGELAPVCGRTVLNLHNVESALHDRCARVERGPVAAAHRVFRDASLRLERKWFTHFSEILAPSEQDAAAVRQIAPEVRVLVYPNALPISVVPDRPREHAVVFSGNLEYHPNVTAVRFFRAQIWPLLRERWPQLVWRLIGRNPAAVRRHTGGDDRIEVIGPVEDAIAELARAEVAVVPLLSGSGTRLKILEAWAAGLPVVSTGIGAEGLPVTHGETLLLADGAAPFAAEVTRLLACTDLRRRLADAGRLLLEKEFTWGKAWAKLDF